MSAPPDLLHECLATHRELLALERRIHAWMEWLYHGSPDTPNPAPFAQA